MTREMKVKPTHPGVILKEEFLDPAGVSVARFAHHIRIFSSTIEHLIDGNGHICNILAVKFAQALNTSPEFWLNLQNQYDVWLIAENRVINAIGVMPEFQRQDDD